MSDAKKGEKCYMYGKHPSAESRQKMSAAHKGKPRSPETRQKLSATRKGKHWTTENGHRIWTE